MKQVLLTNMYFAQYSGSELFIYELAKLFESKGYNVTIAVALKANPMLSLVENHENIKVIEVTKEKLDNQRFDIVFVQHFSVFDYLITKYNIEYKKMIVSILSILSNFELLPSYIDHADVISCVSQECRDVILKKVDFKDKVFVFENSVFESDFSLNNKNELKKIAVISNHVPEEVKELKIYFNNIVSIDYIGMTENPKLVTSSFIKQYDLIITIGRTVQLCFANQIPVYVYDHMGGPGYINMENYELARYHNFSGRGFSKKSGFDLSRDILNKYKENLNNTDFLYDKANKQYNYINNFNCLMLNLNNLEESQYKVADFFIGEEKNRVNFYSETVLNTLSIKTFTSKLFIDYGNGFSEETAIQFNGTQKYELNFSCVFNRPIKALRFDPAESPCKYEIISIDINGNEEVLKQTFEDYSLDPKYEINLKENENIKSINIKYRVNLIDVLHTINVLNEQLREAKRPVYRKKLSKVKQFLNEQMNKPEIIGIMTVFNEELNIGKCIESIQDYVDFIVVFDDASTDRTVEIASKYKKVKKVIKNENKKEWNERKNRETVLREAYALSEKKNPWVLCVDPDERFEINFLKNLRKIASSREYQNKSISISIKELWDSPETYRNDGLWSNKQKDLFFKLNEQMTFDYQTELHIPWKYRELTETVKLDYNLYHLKMIHEKDRIERVTLYNTIDAKKESQSIGYDYLNDKSFIYLEKVDVSHEYDIKTVPDYYY